MLEHIISLVPTSMISSMYDFLKDELSRRNVLIDFDKDGDSTRTIFLRECCGFLIKCQTYQDNPALVNYWSIFQQGECLISITDGVCDVIDAEIAARNWLKMYLSRRRYILQTNDLKSIPEKNVFLYFYSSFEVLCIILPETKHPVSWSAYYKNTRIMSSEEKYDTVTQAQYAAYWRIDKYWSKNKQGRN